MKTTKPFQFAVRIIVLQVILILEFHPFIQAQCAGLNAEAGQDVIVCDPSQLIQLQGSVQGNYTRFFWTPTAGLNNPNVLDPIVTHKNPGRYTFTLNAEGVSSVNLITNGDFENGNSGFSNGYNYVFVNTTEGEYFVTPNPSSWNGGFSNCGDHTSGSGNMLLLNGHPTAGTNCWCQTVTTVPGRLYQFEFWSQSVYPSNIAQLNVKINGNSIGNTTAGGLCNWVQYMVMFTATTSSTQLCITETTGIRGGNDFALDDIALFEKCTDKDDVTVEIVNLVAKIDIPLKPKCSSDIFDLVAIGSSAGPNIRYEWSTDVGTILSQNGLSAKARGSGIYTIKVIYSNGSVSCEAEASIEYIAPEILIGSLSASGKVNCNRDSVVLAVNMSSGSGLYNYKWAPDTSILKGQNTDTVYIKTPRRYTVTITDEGTGCTLVLQTDVAADTMKPFVLISGDSLINCINADAKLNSSQTDTGKYVINWLLPDLSRIIDQSSIVNSNAGNYKLIIENKSNLCRDTAEWNVVIDTIHPQLDLGTDRIIDCINQNVTITNNLNNPPVNHSYYWTINANSITKENLLVDKNVDSASVIRLRIVNEYNGCEATDSLHIKDNREIPFLDVGPDQLLTCRNQLLQLQAQVDLADSVTISWTTVTGSILAGSNTLNPSINGKGWYFIHILNSVNGCRNQDSVYVDENIVKPNAVTGPDLTFSCKDSFKIINASGSSSGSQYLFIWSTPDGMIQSGQGTNQLTVTSPGSYQLIVEDTTSGCRDTAIVQVIPDQNKPVVFITEPDTLNCLHPEVILSASASSPSGGTLDLLWTSNSGAPIQSPKSLQTIITIPGIYTFTASDISNGCSASRQIEVQVDTLKPDIDAGNNQLLNCAVLEIPLNGIVNNRVSQYAYNWTTSNGIIVGDPNQKNIIASAMGIYYFLVVDERNGCASQDSLIITADLVKPTLSIQSPDTLDCLHTNIQIIAMGSSTGNRYQAVWWSQTGNILGNTTAYTITVNQSAWYYFMIIDTLNKCSSVDSVFVGENKIIPQIEIQAALELNCSRSSVDLIGNLRNGGLTNAIQWTTSNGRFVSSVNGLQCTIDRPGTYILSIKNLDNGCEDKDSIVVTENKNIPTGIQLDIQQAKCSGEKAVVKIINILGGQPPFVYYLDNQQVRGPDFYQLAPGLHTLSIVDFNGCSLTKDIQIDQPKSIAVTLPSIVKINYGADYTLQPLFSLPFDSISWIHWSPPDHLSCFDCPSPVVKGLSKETSYSITYADKQGCTAYATILIQLIKRGIWVPNAFSPNGDNINDFFYPVVAEDSYKSILHLSIYDRWGERVFLKQNFQPNDPSDGWNGEFRNEKLNPGVFVYLIEIEWKNGETQMLKGDVTLMR